MDKAPNQFYDLLKIHMPEVYKFHLLSLDKDKGGGGERHIWKLVAEIVEMNEACETGIIYINYTRGHIDRISKRTDVIKKNPNHASHAPDEL